VEFLHHDVRSRAAAQQHIMFIMRCRYHRPLPYKIVVFPEISSCFCVRKFQAEISKKGADAQIIQAPLKKGVAHAEVPAQSPSANTR